MTQAETAATKNKYNLPEKFILFVGGITPLKNFGNLLRAFKLVRKSHPYKLVAVGFKRWKLSQDLNLVDELGLSDDVLFPGFVEDEELPAFYSLADDFVFPSLYEGFGIPALEAMAYGCPVIAPKTGCSREVTGDAEILVDPLKPQEIADSILSCLEDNDLRTRMTTNGLSRVESFSWRKCAQETLAVLNSLETSSINRLSSL